MIVINLVIYSDKTHTWACFPCSADTGEKSYSESITTSEWAKCPGSRVLSQE